jgi:maestro heat-like repeat-containing protein family member 1
MHKFITPVVGALLANLEDKDENIILVSMKSMLDILEIAEDESVSPLLVNICVRLKPSFEKKNQVIRETSINLFGVIHRFADGAVGENLIELIHSSLSTIILHLFDPEVKVVNACKSTIRKLISVLGGKNIIELFAGSSFDPNNEISFDQFPELLAVAFIKDFPNRVSEFLSSLVVFFKSTWGNIISQSCLMSGYILANCGEDLRTRTNLRHTCSSLVLLLKNPNPKVRTSVSKVLGLLYES